MASLSSFAVPMRRKLKCARNSIKQEGTNFSTFLFPAFTDTTLFSVLVWLCSGFMLPLGMRLHCKILPSGSNTIRCEFTWQIGRKSTEQHGCYESRSIKLNFSDSPAYYMTVLHKYNSPAVLCEKTQCKKNAQCHSYFIHEQCQKDISPSYQTLHCKQLPFTLNGLKE